MEIWKIDINRNYCVIAYAMPTHSVHSPIPFKGIPEPPLEVACLHASFFDGLRSGIKTEFMPKVQAVTAMTLDGFHVTPDYSISMLDEWRKDNTNICYLAEATPDNSDYINGLLRMRVVDEIILYTVPFISGTGRHFFKSALPEARWTLSSQKSYSNGVYRSIYTRKETMK